MKYRHLKIWIYPVFIILGLTLLYSCTLNQHTESGTTGTVQSENNRFTALSESAQSSGKSNIFEITSIEIFFDDDASFYGYCYAEDMEIWRSQLKESFGLDIKSISLYDISRREKLYAITDDEATFENVRKYIENGTIRGLFLVGTMDCVEKLAAEGLIQPIDPYLQENEIWLGLPEGYRKSFEVDGSTYGLPSCSSSYAYVRYIRKDWLKALNLRAPETVNGFHEVMKAFTYSDPDGDGINNTYAFEYDYPGNIADIFAAFDARLNANGRLLPSWNPNSGMWEDSMLKPQMQECLEFLNACYTEKLIIPKSEYGDIAFYIGETGSYFMPLSSMVSINGNLMANVPVRQTPELGYLTALSHLIDRNINGYYEKCMWPYVLTVNSSYPKSTVNAFVDVFIGDLDGFMMGAYGPEGIGYSAKGTTAVIVTMPVEETRSMYNGPRILFADPLGRVVKITDADYQYAGITKINEEYERKNKNHESFMQHEMTYRIPCDAVDPGYPDAIYDFRKTAEELIRMIIFGEISYEAALREYRKKGRKLGIEDFIDILNERAASQGQVY